jgi:hypothetical protein
MATRIGIENLNAHPGVIGTDPNQRGQILRIAFQRLVEQRERLLIAVEVDLRQRRPAAIGECIGTEIIRQALAFERTRTCYWSLLIC